MHADGDVELAIRDELSHGLQTPTRFREDLSTEKRWRVWFASISGQPCTVFGLGGSVIPHPLRMANYSFTGQARRG